MDSSKKPISEVMTRTVLEAATDLPLMQAFDMMSRKSVSSVLVVEDGLPLGIVTERDVVRALHRARDLRRLNCVDLMQTPVITVDADSTCLDAYHLMAGRGIRHLAVTDSTGRLIGIASEGDILRDLGVEYYMRFKDVGSVMTSNICALPASATVAQAVALMDEQKHSCVIAIDDAGCPSGILTERDIVRLCHRHENPDRLLLGQTMHSPVRTVTPDGLLHEAVKSMEDAGIRRLVVTDGNGITLGLLTHHEIVAGLEGSYVTYLKDLIQSQAQQLQTSRELVGEKALLENILRCASETAVVATDAQCRIIYCSPAAGTLLDLPQADAMGRDLRDTLARLGWPGCNSVLTPDGLKGDGAHHQELTWHTDKNVRHVELRISRLTEADGTPQGYLLVAQDISRHKWEQLSVRALSDTLRHETAVSNSVIESLRGIFYVVDAHGRLIRWNQGFEKLSGLTAEQLNHAHALRDLFTPDRSLVSRTMGVAIKTGQAATEARMQTRGGEIHHINIAYKRVESGGIPYLVATCTHMLGQRLPGASATA